MEKYDAAIIGGGSAGLAALKRLSQLGKQAILLEAGSKVGAKIFLEEFFILKIQKMAK